jgi:organic hydroperoxide reductase OsmC/OhrA
MSHSHQFNIRTTWKGNKGQGTANYRAYSRDHEFDGTTLKKVAPLPGSSDPVFLGDGRRYSPEELLVASLSSCHMLWYLHLCAEAGIVVVDYVDSAEGTMVENDDDSGQFTRVVLKPEVTITDASKLEQARALHHRAHELCFIARSVNFPVEHDPVIRSTPR